MPSTAASAVLRSGEGHAVDMGGFGVRFLLASDAVSLVEHPIAARSLAAPLHTHTHEDEYTFVLEGEIGVQIGEEVLYATAGDLVFKPRGVAHAFWNRTDAPARCLEVISPGGFEAYFEELAALLPPHVPAPDLAGIAALQARYGIESDFESIFSISAREGLDMPGCPAS